MTVFIVPLHYVGIKIRYQLINTRKDAGYFPFSNAHWRRQLPYYQFRKAIGRQDNSALEYFGGTHVGEDNNTGEGSQQYCYNADSKPAVADEVKNEYGKLPSSGKARH